MSNSAYRRALWGACLTAVVLSTWPAMTAADGLLDPLRRDDELRPRTPPETIRPLPPETPATIEEAIAAVQKQIAALLAEPVKPISRRQWLAAFETRVNSLQARLAVARTEAKAYEQRLADEIRTRSDALKTQRGILDEAAKRGKPPDGVAADRWALMYDEYRDEYYGVKAAQAAVGLRTQWHEAEAVEPLTGALEAMRKRLAKMKTEADEPFDTVRAMHEALKVRAERLRQLREWFAVLQAAQAELKGAKPRRLYPRHIGAPTRSSYWWAETFEEMWRLMDESGLPGIPGPGQLTYDGTLRMAEWLTFVTAEDQILLALAELEFERKTIRKRLKKGAGSIAEDEKKRLEARLADLVKQEAKLKAKYAQDASEQLAKLRERQHTLQKEIDRLEAVKKALKPDQKPPEELKKLDPAKAELAQVQQQIQRTERELKRLKPPTPAN